MTNLPTTARAAESPLALLLDPTRFEHLQRVGSMFAMSPLFPEHLRKGDIRQATANAVLVLNMANRLNEDPLTVAQNIYFVSGRPGWNTTYMISKANMHGVFKGPIDWDVKGSGDSLAVTAFAILSGTERRVQVTCDMKLAKAEGWTKNPKYQSMPEQMLRYRSAAFLIRLYCPEVMVGVPAAVEVELQSMRDVTPPEGDAIETPADPEPELKPRRRAEPGATNEKPTAPETKPAQEPEVTTEPDVTPEPEQAAEGEAEEAPASFDFKLIYDRITNDLLDNAPVGALQEYWSDKGLDAMKTEAPDLYAKLQAEFDAAGQ